MIHTVKGFGIVNKAEVDVFLELSCFFNDPVVVGNLISGSSAFSKSSLNNWKFTVHMLLKPGLENFEHYFTSMWDESNCAVVWALFGIAFLFGGFVFIFMYLFFYFTILRWFCHTSTWILHGYTHVPNPEPPSHLPPHTIPLGHPSAPAPSILYPALNLDLAKTYLSILPSSLCWLLILVLVSS